jgi:hypothetical protein
MTHARSRNAFLVTTRRRFAAALLPIALAISWLLCACTTSSLVESLCDNGYDEDGDNLIDCHDPDCQASDDCLSARAAEITPPDAAVRKPPLYDAGHPPTELGDAWAGTPDGASADAATADSGGLMPPAIDEDAGPPDPCTLCAVDEACVDAKCQPAASSTSGAYHLHVISGVVPLNDAFTFCYDACLISPIAGVCTCPPDPYVRVVLRRDGRETLIGVTDVVEDTTTPTFADNQFEIDIAQGDVLRFEVYDHDNAPDESDLLYTCRVDLRGVSTDSPMDMAIDCLGFAGIANGMPFRILAELTPRPSAP